MRVRTGLALLASFTLVAGACATAGGGGDGVRPRDNEYTNTAQLLMTQAETTEDSTQALEFWRQALEAALQSVQTDSMNPRGYYLAGISAVNVGRHQQADTLLETAVELNPDYAQELTQVREQAWIDLYNQAIEPMSAGQIEEAIERFEAANAMYDERPEAYLNLGAAYAQLGEAEESVEAYESALEIIRSDRITEVDSATAAAWRENEQVAVFNLGQALAQTGEFQRAVGVYEDYLENSPDDISALSNLAVVLVNAEMPDSAMAIYQNLLDRPDLTPREYFSAGVGLYQIEEYERAAGAFRTALEMSPRSRDPLFNLVQTLFTIEDWEEVNEYTQRLLELDPYDPNTYKMRAKALVELGDQQAAGDVIEDLEDLPFEISGLQFQGVGGGGGQVSGILTNRNLEAGTPIRLRFHFLDTSGNEVGTEDVTIQAPAQEESTRIEVRFQGNDPVTGYWYERIS